MPRGRHEGGGPALGHRAQDQVLRDAAKRSRGRRRRTARVAAARAASGRQGRRRSRAEIRKASGRVKFLRARFRNTGLDCTVGRVVEIGAIRFRLENEGCVEEASLSCLVDPGMPIPHRAKAIHGICDNDVAGAPSFGGWPLRSSPSPRARRYSGAQRALRPVLPRRGTLAGRARAARRPATEDTVALSRRAFPGRARATASGRSPRRWASIPATPIAPSTTRGPACSYTSPARGSCDNTRGITHDRVQCLDAIPFAPDSDR